MRRLRKFREEMTAFFSELYVETEKKLVFGDGEEKARIVMIGEAPGEQEALQGKPFVGKAGKNLDEFLLLSGFERKSLYITNTVKIRPTKISDAGRIVNRPPKREEIELFVPWLIRELELIRPETIVTLGNVSLKALLGNERTIGECHGKWLRWRETKVYPLYHPASVIYNPSLKDVYRNDVVRLGEEMRMNRD